MSTESEGDKVILCTLGEGDFIGEMGIIDDTWRTATAKALVDTRLIVVNRDRFTERISETDPIIRSLINNHSLTTGEHL